MIQLYKVSRTVPSGGEPLTILQPVDLVIPDAQFLAIIGPSGSGKSTLLGLIAGLDYPSSGKIEIDGQDITRMNEDQLALLRSRKIGIVFQSFHLVPSLTAYENVIVPMEIAGLVGPEQRTQQLLDDVGLTQRAHHYPSQLSGGEQQRVAIARAFANNPAILLADEPTGNLDTQNGKIIFDLLIKMNRDRGTTLVLVTHEKELAEQADRQIHLREGRIAEDISMLV
jgi:putative ABC transport system ATP-binding protein